MHPRGFRPRADRIVLMAVRHARYLLGAALAFAIVFTVSARKKKDDTQTLDLPKDPPMVALGESSHLTFQISPLSARGLLSQQTKDALKFILKQNGGAQIVHIRAFVAGSGDARRVPQIVSEVLTEKEKKLPLPSVSVVQAGGLPLENAQVVLEVISNAKREVNAEGVRFIAGQTITAPGGDSPVKPLLGKSLDALETKLKGGAPMAVTCFVSQLNDAANLMSSMTARLPGAALDLVQTQRAPWEAMANCEAIAKGAQGGAARLAFSGTQIAFGSGEKDAALAFQRLDRDLAEAAGPSPRILATNIYAVSTPVADLARKLRPDAANLTVLPIDGVAAMDAGFAVDAVAAVK